MSLNYDTLRSESSEIAIHEIGEDETPEGRFFVHRRRFRIKLLKPLVDGSALCHVGFPGQPGVSMPGMVLPVSWTVRRPYTIVPPNAFFGVIQRDDKPQRTVLIRRGDLQPFQILSVRMPSDLISVAVAEISPSVKRLSCTLDPAKLETAFASGEIVVVTDDSLQPEVRIPFGAMKRPGGLCPD